MHDPMNIMVNSLMADLIRSLGSLFTVHKQDFFCALMGPVQYERLKLVKKKFFKFIG